MNAKTALLAGIIVGVCLMVGLVGFLAWREKQAAEEADKTPPAVVVPPANAPPAPFARPRRAGSARELRAQGCVRTVGRGCPLRGAAASVTSPARGARRRCPSRRPIRRVDRDAREAGGEERVGGRVLRLPVLQPTISGASFVNARSITATKSEFGIIPLAPASIHGTFNAPSGWPAANSSSVRTST